MTRSEYADYKTSYIEKRQKALRRTLSTIERKIYSAVLDNVFDSLKVENGVVVADPNNIALTGQIDKIFEQLQRGEMKKLAGEIVKDFRGIASKNAEYFRVLGETQSSIKSVYDKSKDQLGRSLGLADNKLTGGGFLERLISDDAFRTKIKSVLTTGIVSNTSFDKLKSDLKLVIVGDKRLNGGLTNHFETNLIDTYNHYDRSISTNFANSLGLKAFIYAGGKIGSSREFCKTHDGKVYTKEESDLWKSQLNEIGGPIWNEDVDGVYDPLKQMGGYRCRHSVDWISKQEAIRRRPELKSYFES